MKKYLYTALFFIFLLNSCYVDDNMDRTIFIPDANDPSLPAYSEWGYNSFGAVYDRSYFLASNNIVPCKITYQKGILNFYLIGNVYRESAEMMLTFSFPSQPIYNYADLVKLNNTTIDLLDASCTVKIKCHEIEDIVTPVSGNLTFKRVQLLKIDGEENRVILSGLFDLKFLKNDMPESISNGRFDVGINNDFYCFPE